MLNSINEHGGKVQKGLGTVMRTFAGMVGGSSSTPERGRTRRPEADESDDDERDEDIFYTDETLDLMIQLKDVLAISIAQGWDIFYEE